LRYDPAVPPCECFLRSLLTLFDLAVVGGGDGVLLAPIAARHSLVLLVQQSPDLTDHSISPSSLRRRFLIFSFLCSS
jgi:hypothetical protein